MSGVLTLRVHVPVTTLWAGPQAPRPVDAPLVADQPDVGRWLAAMDEHADDPRGTAGDGRLGLHGRIHTQLVAGEPVHVLGSRGAAWSEVVCPWQPSRTDPRGYRGWVRTAHLVSTSGAEESGLEEDAATGPIASEAGFLALRSADHPALVLARRHLGLPYLWGGMSPAGLDCSGMVHLVWRELGVIIPRDADDQQDAAPAVALGQEAPGDLYFFAHPGTDRAHHVGIVVEPSVMIHAPESGRGICEESLDDARRETLSGVGRVAVPSRHRTG
jgi:hypothetical protein